MPTKKPTKKKTTKKKTAVRSVVAPDTPNRSQTTSIRKIANGWVITQDNYDPKKGYSTKETFTSKKPKFEIKL